MDDINQHFCFVFIYTISPPALGVGHVGHSSLRLYLLTGLGLPCEGILHQQPGLVPFKTSTGYAPDFYSSAEGTQGGPGVF